MREVVEWLRSIPDVIWSGVVASIITLTGVFISNSSNTRRLRLQLHHDAVERQKERVNALRRDVYLKAAEEISRANSYLASLTQLDVTKSNVADGLKEFFAISAKLQLVAEPKTALLVNDLTAAYGELDILGAAGFKVASTSAWHGLWSITVSQTAPVLPYLLMVLMLIVRPRGLMGTRES